MDTGLEKIVAAETILSDVDGERGRLIIRGMAVEELAKRYDYERTAHLLWEGLLPGLPAAKTLAGELGVAREKAFKERASECAGGDIVRALRLGWAWLKDDETPDCAIMIAGAAPVLIAAAIREAGGLAPIPPDPALGQAEDFLRMLRGEAASAAEVRALNAYLVTVSDHGLNASTFAARIVASTRPGLVSAVVAGLSALKGPLHGGAPGPVLDMFDAIGTADKAEAWIEAALKRGERLMGFGHRIYRVRDPRADALKAAVRRLPGTAGRIAFAESIEADAIKKLAARYPSRALETNVEFYTALLLEALGIPRTAFTAIFAFGRVLGWIAHAHEQIAEGRIVRPKSIYVGPSPRPRGGAPVSAALQ